MFGPPDRDQYIVSVMFNSPLEFNNTDMVQLLFNEMSLLIMMLDVMSTPDCCEVSKPLLSVPVFTWLRTETNSSQTGTSP